MWVLILTLAYGSVTDRVVAVVDAEVVLDSDARIAIELRTARSHLFWKRPEATLEAALVRAAAGDLSLYQPDTGAIQRRLDRLERELAQEWPALIARWDLAPADLRSLVRKRLITENWVTRNVSATDPMAFDAELTTLLTDLERRFRVRRVRPIDASPHRR